MQNEDCGYVEFCNWSVAFSDSFYALYIAPLMTDLDPGAYKNSTVLKYYQASFPGIVLLDQRSTSQDSRDFASNVVA